MVVVEDLEERLYLGPDLDLLLAHLLSHGSRMTVYTSNEGVTVRLLCGTVVIVLDNDGLPAGISTAQHQHDFTSLHKLPHYVQERPVKSCWCWAVDTPAGRPSLSRTMTTVRQRSRTVTLLLLV